MTNSNSEEGEKKKIGDIVYLGFTKGVIINVITKTKWTYYKVVFDDAVYTSNDFHDNLVEYEIIREDNL